MFILQNQACFTCHKAEKAIGYGPLKNSSEQSIAILALLFIVMIECLVTVNEATLSFLSQSMPHALHVMEICFSLHHKLITALEI